MSEYPTNSDDVIDSRDVITAIEELQTMIDDGEATTEEQELLKALTALAEEASGYASDWPYGETLIRDDYFEEYAQQLAEDTAGTHEEAELIRNGGGSHWPLTFMRIDWEAAAAALKQDYTTVDFDGVDYWIRSY